MTERWEDIPKHLTIQKSLAEWAKGEFTVEGTSFSFRGTRLPRDINERIISMATKNENPEKFFRFWERLQKNPSFRSVQQLWPFLNHRGIPITDDGCFLAYKAVRHDFKDVHSNTFDNKPGTVNEMPRNQISDDPNFACHEGFHVGALRYAQTFHRDGRIVICKIDPADVVCIPFDSSQEKMRVCKYQVIGLHNGEYLPSTTFTEDTSINDPKTQVAPQDHEDDDYDPETDPLTTACDECGNAIPDAEPSAVNSFHASSCSAYEAEVVDLAAVKAGETVEIVKEEVVQKEPEPFSPESTAAAAEEIKKMIPKKQKEEKREPKKGWVKFNKMGFEELMKQSLDDLRQYAGKGLDIVGASKIPGGKNQLVAKILEVRK